MENAECKFLEQILQWSQYFIGNEDAFLITGINGNIKFLNPNAEQLFGYSLSEVLGQPVEIFVPLNYAEKHSVGLKAVGQNTPQFLGFYREVSGRKKDGTLFPVEIKVSLLIQNQCSLFLALMRDFSERKKIEKELIWAKEAAESANRSKSGFLANMSHELRTPLNSIIGFANILLKNKQNNLLPQELLFLEKIRKNGNHLLKLINSILDLSKVEAGRIDLQLETFCLKTLILEILQELESQFIEKHLEVLKRFPTILEFLRTDREKFKQVLINLIGNAIKFTEKGAIKIHIESDSEDRPTHIHIIDSGIGIPKEKVETIFEAFSQADNSISRQYGGTGLGLTISRALLELMGFSLQVQSTVGEGTTFTIALVKTLQIRLPHEGSFSIHDEQNHSVLVESDSIAGLVEDPVLLNVKKKKFPDKTERIQFNSTFANLQTLTDKKEAEKLAIKERLANKLILVIDDERDSYLLIKEFLQEFNCETVWANSGKHGLLLAEGLLPRIIFLDLLMAQTTGWEILKTLKENSLLKYIPVIVQSIVGKENRASLDKAAYILEKPFGRKDLIRALEASLSYQEKTKVLIVEKSEDARSIILAFSQTKQHNIEMRILLNENELSKQIQEYNPDYIIFQRVLFPLNTNAEVVQKNYKQVYDYLEILVRSLNEIS